MKMNSKILLGSFFCIQLGGFLNAQSSNDFSYSLGISYGHPFIGPMNQMARHLEDNGFGITAPGFIFGPISYPTKSGPRRDLNFSYAWSIQNKKEIEIEFNLVDLGKTMGLNESGQILEFGFESITIGVNYRFGSRLTKLSIGPALMFNKMYAVQIENYRESGKRITSNPFTIGIKSKVLIYLWNRRVTYSNIGLSYLLSYPTEQGPFPLNENSGSQNQLEETKINFAYGSVFFSLGFKI